MSERWLPIPGWEGLYEVSDLGRVRSLKRPGVKGHSARIMKGSKAGAGYRKVILWHNGRTEHIYVHRLVLTAFVGPCPEGMEACHGNAVRDDNRLENLRWDTGSENIRDIVRAGNHPEAKKTHCPRGHRLVWPNLVVGELKRGHRKCRACNQARAVIQRAGGDIQTISNERYAIVLRGEAA